MLKYLKFFWELVGDALIIVWASLWLNIFIDISIHGGVTLVESVAWIRNIEMGLAGLLVLFGLERFIDDIKRQHERKRASKKA